MASNEKAAAATTQPELTVESAIEQAKRAFALRKYEQAVELYGTALELLTKEAGEDAPETADLYFSYGKALLENAIAQNGVLGKDQPEVDAAEDASSKGSHRPILSFSGDAEDGDDPTIDLLNAPLDDEDEEEGEAEAEDEEGEPEDDFNAAWEVLELAKTIYEKQLQTDSDEEVQLKLADTFIALGDVSLETEKFDQAIGDYQSGLDLKVKLLPTSSRQIAEAHYKLSMVLDLTSGRLADAIGHVEQALESVEHRLAELRSGLDGQLPPLPAEGEEKVDVKGKGKQVAKLVRDDVVQKMTKTQIEAEIKELNGLKEDLVLKIEEMKTQPHEGEVESAPALAAKALDSELNVKGTSSSASAPAVVNDLTSIVKKKKKPAPAADAAAAGNGKRKADDSEEVGNNEKKARLEDEMQT
ncbi:hypothetical protein EST38_g2820 [Candolleomyces aberdarensis]|uniref:Tetratricopeptide SHNi-TPR domain-containing protein n=1 Tax=Candolleomyces aberdarensis TaxID=2316362 RepID=A0A4Q2DV64_9AGAR|nr:hypothetical protein EST38_g2820 [Candolleomyces aberdarensis]